jgi:hypothetical protein
MMCTLPLGVTLRGRAIVQELCGSFAVLNSVQACCVRDYAADQAQFWRYGRRLLAVQAPPVEQGLDSSH